ncbi:MAG: flagellar motor protein [Pseudomonadota bacterium]
MDWASVAGIVLAIAGIVIGQKLEGGALGSLVQPAAFAIVVVGTVGAVLFQSRMQYFIRGVKMTRWVFLPPPENKKALARDINAWTFSARREGVLSLENFMHNTRDPFIAKGLGLIVDGVEVAKIREILDVEIFSFETEERQAVKIWEAAGGYSPTIGILGAVLGLIHVMENLSDPSKLGSGIAVAFVATIYGVGLANLVFLPISHKLKAIVARAVSQREMLAAVFCDLAQGDSSRVIEERVAGFLKSS